MAAISNATADLTGSGIEPHSCIIGVVSLMKYSKVTYYRTEHVGFWSTFSLKLIQFLQLFETGEPVQVFDLLSPRSKIPFMHHLVLMIFMLALKFN